MYSDEIRKMKVRNYCGAMEIPKQEHYIMFSVDLLKEAVAQLAEIKEELKEIKLLRSE